jgi:hypothetical protein
MSSSEERETAVDELKVRRIAMLTRCTVVIALDWQSGKQPWTLLDSGWSMKHEVLAFSIVGE